MATSTQQPDCPLFLQFLERSVETEAEIRILQEYFGYCLMKQAPHQVCLLMLSPRGAGKSLVAYLLREMVGPELCAGLMPEELADKSKLAELEGKQVNICPVGNPSEILSARFRSFLGCDAFNIMTPEQYERKVQSNVRFVLTASQVPRELRTDQQFKARVLMVRFRPIPHDRLDPYLTEKLAAELPGIKDWALLGVRRLRTDRGFTQIHQRNPDCAKYTECLDNAALTDTNFNCYECAEYAPLEFNYNYQHRREDTTYYMTDRGQTIPRAEKAVR
ncbi:MAG: hypothetical protein MI802_29110 [Desulfobacterales bacterium]|nr:hypothetical protein [Desulfobacterales bacterium]